MEFQVFARRRMDEAECARVQQLTSDFDASDLSGPAARAVQLIACKRVLLICHVDSYLMSAPGLELCFYKSISAEALKHLYMSDGVLCSASVHGTAHSVAFITADGGVYRKIVFT